MRRKTAITIFTLLISFLCPFFLKAQEYRSVITVDKLHYIVLNNQLKTVAVFRLADDVHNLVIPEQIVYEGRTFQVTEIADQAFNSNNRLTGTLTIPNSVVRIGNNAFSYCSRLTGSLIIPNSVKEVGELAFADCTGFTSLELSNSLMTLGESAFNGCSGFSNELEIPSSLTIISAFAFSGCSGFTGLSLPNSLKTIGSYAFRNCSGFNSLIIPNSVTTIESRAFSNCSFRGSLTIPNSVTTIGSYAFSSCWFNGGTLTIPNSINIISEGAFYNCRGFSGSLIIPNSVEEIDKEAFYGCTGFTSLELPNSLTTIRDGAFEKCKGFTGSLIIPNTVTTIGSNAFNSCTGFTSLVLPNSLQKICYGTFYECSGFTGSLVLPESLQEIEGWAFQGCSGFTALKLPNSITIIGSSAFEECCGFTGSLILPESLTEIQNDAFMSCYGFNGNLVFQDSITYIGSNAFRLCENFIGSLVMPKALQKIGENAFEFCRRLSGELVFHDSIIEIGKRAFAASGIFDKIIINAKTPPKNGDLTDHCFNGYKRSKLFVPQNSKSQYQSAWDWKDFEYIYSIEGDKIEKIDMESSVSLKVGEAHTLNVTIIPENVIDDTIVFTSSNPNIATVEANGKVTAISEGKSIITATATNGVFAKCEITVIETSAEEIVIDKDALGITGDNLEMRVGEIKKINVTVKPETTTDKSVTFTSSDSRVASVDKYGNVKAVALGKATITITATSGVSTQLNVSVIATPVTSIFLNKTEVTLKAMESVNLIATVLPNNASDKMVTWESSDESIATVNSNGRVTAISAGTATITVTAASGGSASCIITVLPRTTTPITVTCSKSPVIIKDGEKAEMWVMVKGGFPEGLSYLWTHNGVPLGTTNELTVIGYCRGTEKATETYSVRVTDVCDGVTIFDEVYSFVVETWPNPESDISINLGSGITSDNMKVREGSNIELSVDTPKGGYASNWSYTWYMNSWEYNNVIISHNQDARIFMTLPEGTEKETYPSQIKVKAENIGPYGTTWAEITSEPFTVTTYRRPQTPVKLQRKGDGSSHTLVAMSELSDETLTQLEYSFVYGYTDVFGDDQTIATTSKRYCRVDENVLNSPDYNIWCYSQWTYPDGSSVTSGKRFIDGRRDESFDASDFSGNAPRNKRNLSDVNNWIQTRGDGFTIALEASTETNISIYNISGLLIDSVIVPAGSYMSKEYDTDSLSPDLYVVSITSSEHQVIKKVLIK